VPGLIRVLGEAAPPAIAVDVNGCQFVEVLIPKSALCCRFLPYRRRSEEWRKATLEPPQRNHLALRVRLHGANPSTIFKSQKRQMAGDIRVFDVKRRRAQNRANHARA